MCLSLRQRMQHKWFRPQVESILTCVVLGNPCLSSWRLRALRVRAACHRYFLEKLVGLGVDDGVKLNPVLVSVFLLMGIHPSTFAALMTPSARSANKVRAHTCIRPAAMRPALLLLPQPALYCAVHVLSCHAVRCRHRLQLCSAC
jgi:hypothetical protein